jgi:hypothetical protein
MKLINMLCYATKYARSVPDAEGAMQFPVPFHERSRPVQGLLAVLVPLAFGAVLGVVLGIAAAGYWALSVVATIGGILVGLEHENARDGVLRGLVGGACFGLGVLVAHEIAGTDAKVDLGDFPPVLIVIDAVGGALLGALGARLARGQRQP